MKDKTIKGFIHGDTVIKIIRLVPDFIAYLASIITIIVVYYNRSGSYKFNIENPIDWIISVISTYVLIIGINNILYKSRYDRKILVNKEILKMVNKHYWKNAKSSLTIIAGDISWIKDDYTEIIKIKKSKNIDIYIYYDESKIAEANIAILRELSKEGIVLRKYPLSDNLNIRCLITDKNDISNQKLITYEKISSSTINIEPKYYIKIIEKNDDKYLMVIKYLVDVLSCKNENMVLVGFSGTNNVGKTTLVKGVNEILKKNYDVMVVEDIFRSTGQKTEKKDNISALLKQLNEIFDSESEIILVDHTPLDTLAYIRLFDEDIYSALYAEVVNIMKKFDCLYNVSIKNDKFDTNTKLVDKKSRKIVYDTINEVYRNNNIQSTQIQNHRTDMNIANINMKKISDSIIDIKREKML